MIKLSRFKLQYRTGYFYVFVFLLTLGMFATISNLVRVITFGGNNWGIGEWLINYDGGFVRRGLIGQILLSSKLTGTSLLLLIICVQLILYCVILIYLTRILKENRFSLPLVALICSPMGINFVGWDKFVLIRKEFIGLVSLVILAQYIRGKSSQKSLLWIFYALFILAIFSSEVNLALVPGVIFLFWLNSSTRSRSYFYRELFAIVFLVSLSVLISIRFNGDREIANSICQKVISVGLDPEKNCRGAVDVLGMSFSSMIDHLISSYPIYFIYLIYLFLACLPIVFLKSDKLNLCWILFLFIGTVPLYLIAWDYGRWIFLFVLEITICLSVTQVKVKPKNRFNYMTTFLYSFLWGSGHGGDPLQNGWIGAMPTLIRNFFSIFYK